MLIVDFCGIGSDSEEEEEEEVIDLAKGSKPFAGVIVCATGIKDKVGIFAVV